MASTSNSTCASPSTSTSTSTVDGNNSYPYDVFLNHRGTDVKETFASALYDGLKAHRLEVFLDKNEMRPGEKITCQIQGAIRAASVNIAIFSPNYCESHWCLDELLLMLESMRKSGSTILPVFLGVKSSELRCKEREKGMYAQALRLLQEKTTFGSLPPLYDDNTIGKWKEALTEVADISGFELQKSPYNGDEGKLLAAVVERVREIVPKILLDVSTFPTGYSAFASTSASTSTADGNNCDKYAVFLNHRGPDVKKTFVSHLYRALKENGLRVFLDREELQKGDELNPQIEGAIRDASVQIAIFSHNYCESPWCLKELLLMLKSKKERGSTIIPVFYGVKPSELRWMRGDNGVYARALRILEEKKTFDSETGQNKLRYQPETIRKWRKALHDVAEIIGLELEAYGGDEGQLLEEVVEQVLKIVPKPPLYVSKYPTGLDDKVNEFKENVLLQQHENGEARVVGIVGLGGVGKTTLAKEFFNGERKNYRRSSFLSDVRENSSGGSLNSLQIILIKDLTQRDVKINDTNEGITRLKEYLSPSKNLIIIDDVDHTDQLDALVSPAKDVLKSSNSLIVVTSRDKGVLRSWGIDDSFIYELKGLDPQHSNELFCQHAFDQSDPVAGFEQVVNKFVDACDGLPLSLKVIGALLRGEKNLEIWRAQLSKLSEILPADIQNTLKISYDRLDKEDQQIFLDTACFFIGKEKDTAIRIWDGSGWHGSLGLQNLQNKCLVEVVVERYRSDVECIRMHDHVRDLGRSLADQEPLRRIWRVAESLSDQSHVPGVKTSAECDRLVTELRTKLPDSKGSCVESVFSIEQPSQLILLRWYNCPYSSLDSKISTENLRILYIQGSNLEKLWESQAPLQLRELYIEASRLFKIPESIGQLKRLEKIFLRDCSGWTKLPLETLPDEFCQLASLKHLELSYCNYLRSLPDSFGNLTSLQYIKFESCNCLEMLPDSFGNLTKLQHLFLISSYKLHMLPDSLGNLTELQHICLCYCSRLRMLPNSFGNLTKLRHIHLKDCINLQMLPYSFGNLKQLKFLCLAGCEQLTVSSETLGNITTLEHFSLSNSSRCCLSAPVNIKVLPSQLTYQQSLQRLLLGFDFKELPTAIGNLSNLKVLSLASSCLEMLPPSFGDLRSLEDLELESCPLKCFPDSTRMLTQLKKLRISCIKNLERLEIKECPSREVGGEIETATDSRGRGVLSKLDASEASYSNAVFPNLQHLHIYHCDRLVEVGALPTTLQTLNIFCCCAMEELPSMETLVSLEGLETEGCHKLKRIHGLGQLTKLKKLNFIACYELEELPGVEHSRSLGSVSALGCRKLPREYKSLHRTCNYYF